MSDLPEGMTHEQSLHIIVGAVRRLAGHQVISTEKAFTVLTGISVERLSRNEEDFVAWLLRELEYEPMWVAEVCRDPMQRMWVRKWWGKMDFVVNSVRPVTVYIPMQ